MARKSPPFTRSLKLTPEDEPLLEKMSAAHVAVLRAEGNYETMAESLGIADGTLKSRLFRARAILRSLREKAQEAP